MSRWAWAAPVLLWGGALHAQPASDPVHGLVESAYRARAAKRYDAALQTFRAAIQQAPARADLRKEYAYTLLKTGQTEAAREQFAEAFRLDPKDLHAGLEYAFLCFETKKQREARRLFDRIRKAGDPSTAATAEETFLRIDRALAEGIARWSKAVEANPNDFSAHLELARLYEQRDDPAAAAVHYEKAWRLKPLERALLLDLGRMWSETGRGEQAMAAWLAASRGSEPRAAEAARAQLPRRYPYASEFERAIALDPSNPRLRRELGFLLLAVGRPDKAEDVFRQILETAPDDLLAAAQLGFLLLARNDRAGAMPLLERVLAGNDPELRERVRRALEPRQSLITRPAPDAPPAQPSDPKSLGDRSYTAGNLSDALRYFHAAREADPNDYQAALKLGWTYNMLRQDEEALRYFEMARRAPDAAVSAEAGRAYRNLRPLYSRFRTTSWIFPMFSSRWHEGFAYGQVKTEIRIGRLPVRPYLSARFVGDTQAGFGQINPMYLSESSFILGVGLASPTWRGFTGWAEAGSAVRYRERRDVGRMVPDYRGGVSYGRGFGSLLGGERAGPFQEFTADGVFLSRYQNDVLLYAQHRAGYTLPRLGALGGLEWQVLWNLRATGDTRRQHWANFLETGPGLRFRWQSMPRSMAWSVDFLRGAYLMRNGNPNPPVYYDVRAGMWYAFTR